MKAYIVTIRMLRKNPAHNPQAKVSGPCPVSEYCTDVTGEHHSFISAGPQDEAEAAARWHERTEAKAGDNGA